MVIVRLWGGLGNQLFQYAFAYCRARTSNADLALDMSFFDEKYIKKNKRFTKRKADILGMNIDTKCFSIPISIRKKVQFLQRKNVNRLIRIPRYSCIHIGSKYKYVKESRFSFNPKYNKTIENVYYDGYWQCESYFKSFRDELVRQFVPKTLSDECLEILKNIKNTNSVMIHIRRGDYVGNKHLFSTLYLIDENYYCQAIDYFNKNQQKPCFFVFSDDIEWAKEHLSHLEDVVFVSGGNKTTSLEEFYLMTQCKNYIVSNSTFSWWGAWLSESENKVVIRPSKWFGNRDIFPKEWIPIEVQ